MTVLMSMMPMKRMYRPSEFESAILAPIRIEVNADGY